MALEKPALQVRVAGGAGASCSLPGLDFSNENVLRERDSPCSQFWRASDCVHCFASSLPGGGGVQGAPLSEEPPPPIGST
jgi:hypothetical protein